MDIRDMSSSSNLKSRLRRSGRTRLLLLFTGLGLVLLTSYYRSSPSTYLLSVPPEPLQIGEEYALWADNFDSPPTSENATLGWDWIKATAEDRSLVVKMGLERYGQEERAGLAKRIRGLVEDLSTTYKADSWRQARTDTLESLSDLADRIEANTATEREMQVVLGGSSYFGGALYGANSGENIWARSSIDAFLELGHTLLYAYDTLEILAIHTAIPELITHIIVDSRHAKECSQLGWPTKLTSEDLKDWAGAKVLSEEELSRVRAELGLPDDGPGVDRHGDEIKWGWRIPTNSEHLPYSGCIKRKGFEHGIPIWKFFTIHFWGGPDHPLGRGWTLSPEPLEGIKPTPNFYLGYSVEKYCRTMQMTPHAERLNRAFILAKNEDYLDKGRFKFWNEDRTFSEMHDALDIDFVTTAGRAGLPLKDTGVTSIGRQAIEKFYHELGLSKALLGVGNPWLSPTPYDALCMGVPFINPVNGFKKERPEDRSEWNCQHNGLFEMGPPYVYPVLAGDVEGYQEAVRQAVKTPIESTILPRMTRDANRARHHAFLQMDWAQLAERRFAKMRDAEHDLYFML